MKSYNHFECMSSWNSVKWHLVITDGHLSWLGLRELGGPREGGSSFFDSVLLPSGQERVWHKASIQEALKSLRLCSEMLLRSEREAEPLSRHEWTPRMWEFQFPFSALTLRMPLSHET